MGDANYWKNKYKEQWSKSNDKEDLLKDIISEETGVEVEFSGFGAGSTEYLRGSAADYDHTAGDADLHIKDSNIYVEVTGPMSDKVTTLAPLWFRPDKIENAIHGLYEGCDTYLAHYLPSRNLWRVIHITPWFAERYKNGKYKLVMPEIRGSKERFVEIQTNDPAVRDVSFLMKNIYTKMRCAD